MVSTSASTRVTRTFAFIDLCGFSDFVDEHGDDAAVAELSALRATVREVAAQLGVRIDKWLGDGVMLVGVDVQPVVAALVAIGQRHGRQARLPLRAGMATGPVIICEGDDYVGRAVNLAARLCDLARPDQILAAHDGLALPPSVRATDSSSLPLKGFARPIPVVALLPTERTAA